MSSREGFDFDTIFKSIEELQGVPELEAVARNHELIAETQLIVVLTFSYDAAIPPN